MKSYLLALALIAGLVFGASGAYAKSNKFKTYLGTKCFVPLELQIDKHDNVFAFFGNTSVRDLRYMPYHYWALEVYGLQPKQADVFYNRYNAAKTPISISSVLTYLKRNNFVCHVRGQTPYWPYIIYYNCISKESTGLLKV